MKVKLLYVSVDYTGEYEDMVSKGVEDTEWEEIKDDDYYTLQQAVYQRNRLEKYEHLILVRYPSKEVTVNLLASEYLEKIKKDKIREEKAKIDYEKKKLETKKKRDLAKLEKLKREYEKTNSPS